MGKVVCMYGCRVVYGKVVSIGGDDIELTSGLHNREHGEGWLID